MIHDVSKDFQKDIKTGLLLVKSSTLFTSLHVHAVHLATCPRCSPRYVSTLFTSLRVHAVHLATCPRCSPRYVSTLFTSLRDDMG
ncbi:hypothetical protein RRG08_057522 [Elysia crispata]|uniref:Uncharacterized protein n=1 Tax=Elysia crispata TaxID=231223 RepID=A0AAE0ZBS1_9GAST|nr:hypothetical protein RRG08_057522 [Elysia crispata]